MARDEGRGRPIGWSLASRVPARPSPIPPQVLARLAALDDCCDMMMLRTSVATQTADGRVTGSRNYSRYWKIEIFSRIGREKGCIIVEHATLAVALKCAVEMAEQKTWPV